MAEILVLGAGMVGVSTALALQARGHSVQLLDRGAPGRETSFGNAGVIQTEAAEPYAMPRDPRVILAMMTGRSNDLTWSLRGLAGMAPALWSYFRNSAASRHAVLSQTYARLTSRAAQDHQPLIEAAGCDNLIARDGMAQIYRDPRAFERDATDAERIAARYGPRFCTFDGASYRREDPALQAEPAGVLLWSDTWSCSSPGGLVAAYAALFERRGGRDPWRRRGKPCPRRLRLDGRHRGWAACRTACGDRPRPLGAAAFAPFRLSHPNGAQARLSRALSDRSGPAPPDRRYGQWRRRLAHADRAAHRHRCRACGP